MSRPHLANACAKGTLRKIMELPPPTLADLGWTPFQAAQMSPEEERHFVPVRVMAVYRGLVTIAGEGLDALISSRLPDPAGIPGQRDEEDRAAVGDWLLIDPETHEPLRILERMNLFKRPAPGDDRRTQLIAANVDTLFIVTSCNQDFSVPRLERYLVLAREVGVRPVVVLTKIDLAEDAEEFARAARALQPGLEVELVNARDPASVSRLADCCGPGQTVALLGSSGVGKSTLVNTLRGSDTIATQEVREIDGKGRHTTTVREMHRLAGGGWLMDTPGMREFKIAEVDTGIAEVFDDIVALTRDCRFADCTHETEPGCAVQAALSDGTIDAGRMMRWQKLAAEDAINTIAAATRKSRMRKSGKKK